MGRLNRGTPDKDLIANLGRNAVEEIIAQELVDRAKRRKEEEIRERKKEERRLREEREEEERRIEEERMEEERARRAAEDAQRRKEKEELAERRREQRRQAKLRQEQQARLAQQQHLRYLAANPHLAHQYHRTARASNKHTFIRSRIHASAATRRRWAPDPRRDPTRVLVASAVALDIVPRVAGWAPRSISSSCPIG